jgi:hypothetical protein
MKKSNNNIDSVVMNKIYLVRGQKVMLDKDLANLYNVQAIRLREQVKRNRKRFPKNFMFRLTTKEVNYMVSQNAIPPWQHLGGTLPFAFTEHGVLMLANILKSHKAVKMSIRIIEIFVKIREALLSNKEILLKLEQLEGAFIRHDSDIQTLFEELEEIVKYKIAPMRKIGFHHKNS